jgi:hypothetical protein
LMDIFFLRTSMLTAAQVNFLRNKGVNEAFGNLLANVRERRQNRERSAAVLTRYRNYQRTKNEFNALRKKFVNLGTNVGIQLMRLRRIPAHRATLFTGGNLNPAQATLRNRIRALPRNVPKTVNMKEFVRLFNAHEAMRGNLVRSMNTHRTAMLQFIRVMHPFDFNPARFSANQLNTYAVVLSKNLKYNKGKVIGRIVGNRATNPHTAFGRRMIMKKYPGNTGN